MRNYVGKLLARPVPDAVVGLRQPAPLREITDTRREAVEGAAAYLRARSRQLDYAAALRKDCRLRAA